jgi:hypothetical protein
MTQWDHYIVFQRACGHCVTWLVVASSLREAMVKWIYDGDNPEVITSDDGYGAQIVYDHPLAYIESEEKARDGGEEWNEWEIRKLHQKHLEADVAEVFCSENPGEVEEHIEACRPLLRQRYPRSRAKGFVWYLKDGPLVTFYRPKNPRRRWPIEVLCRFQLRRKESEDYLEWNGSHDDILEQMNIDYPLPAVQKGARRE